MSPTEAIEPVAIRAPRGAKILEIEWSDGTETAFDHRLLRGFCPCAYCQGHQGPIRWSPSAPGQALDLESISEVGQYALGMTWSDGHSTGIYSFAFLRALRDLAGSPLGEADDEELRSVVPFAIRGHSD